MRLAVVILSLEGETVWVGAGILVLVADDFVLDVAAFHAAALEGYPAEDGERGGVVRGIAFKERGFGLDLLAVLQVADIERAEYPGAFVRFVLLAGGERESGQDEEGQKAVHSDEILGGKYNSSRSCFCRHSDEMLIKRGRRKQFSLPAVSPKALKTLHFSLVKVQKPD